LPNGPIAPKPLHINNLRSTDEQLAEAICCRLPGHGRLMDAWLESIEQRL
jgi:hypothetical protein